jgi:hypothetical protein
MERIDCWYEALSMWKSHPLTGVGFGQFGEYHYLTAHNSFMLTLAELGFPGMLLFSAILYVSLKIPVTLLQRVSAGVPVAVEPAALAVFKPWAMALVAALSGLLVGIFFLSFAYHYVLWIYVGLSGALYSAVRRHDPDFEVYFRWRDLWRVAAIDLAIIVAVFIYTHFASTDVSEGSTRQGAKNAKVFGFRHWASRTMLKRSVAQEVAAPRRVFKSTTQKSWRSWRSWRLLAVQKSGRVGMKRAAPTAHVGFAFAGLRATWGFYPHVALDRRTVVQTLRGRRGPQVSELRSQGSACAGRNRQGRSRSDFLEPPPHRARSAGARAASRGRGAGLPGMEGGQSSLRFRYGRADRVRLPRFRMGGRGRKSVLVLARDW